MDQRERTALFRAIEAYLAEPPAPSALEEDDAPSRLFWDGRTRISVNELAILRALTYAPLCVGSLASLLERDPDSILASLATLRDRGIVEEHAEGYANTPAAHLFCRTIARL